MLLQCQGQSSSSPCSLKPHVSQICPHRHATHMDFMGPMCKGTIFSFSKCYINIKLYYPATVLIIPAVCLLSALNSLTVTPDWSVSSQFHFLGFFFAASWCCFIWVTHTTEDFYIFKKDFHSHCITFYY